MCILFTIDGFGDWSSKGCHRDESYNKSDESVTCYCNHLTSFSILLVNDFFVKQTSHFEKTYLLTYNCITVVYHK